MAVNKTDLITMFEKNSIGFPESFLKSILKPSGRGGVYAARDYIHANAVIASMRKYGVNPNDCKDESSLSLLPRGVKFRLSSYTPCLAYRYDELKADAQKRLFDKENYLFTEKENGVRGWLIIADGRTFLFSRNYSDVDCNLLDYWQNIAQNPQFDEKEIFAIDVELKYEPDGDLISRLKDFGMETESKLEAMSALLQTRPETAQGIQNKYKEIHGTDLITFRLLYPLYFKGKNYVTKRKLADGHAIYNEVVEYAQQHGLNVQPIRRCKGSKEKKEAFLNGLLDAGAEGCFKGTSRVLMADGSYQRIDSIKEGDLVMSFNHKTGLVESKEVEIVWDNGLKSSSEWCCIDWNLETRRKYKGTDKLFNPGYSRIYCTRNHKFFDGKEYIRVDSIKNVNYVDNNLDFYRRHALLGWILSDGGICENKDVYCEQLQSSDYWKFTLELFKGFYKKELTFLSGKGSVIGKIQIMHKYTDWIQQFRNKEEQDYCKIFDHLNEVSLAYLFMGDGGTHSGKTKKKGGLSFSLHSMSMAQLEKFQAVLIEKFGIDSSLKLDKRVNTGSGCSVYLDTNNSIKLASLIGKHVHPSMRYKLRNHDLEDYSVPISDTKVLVSTDILISDFPKEGNLRAWDLQVSDNHNYFVEGVLVHNCVVHNLASLYCTSENRDKDTFIKIKRSVGKSQEGMGDTIEGYISGFKMSSEDAGNAGLIGSLEISVFMLNSTGKQVPHVIAYVPNLSKELKEQCTVSDADGNPTLAEEYYDMVVEMDGQAISAKSMRLTHPRMLRFRFDKTKYECIYTQEFLESQKDTYR